MENKQIIFKLLGLLKNFRKTIILIMGCLLLSTIINLCQPIFSKNIMDLGFIGGNRKLLFILAVLVFLFQLIDSILNIVKEKKRVNIAAQVQYDLSEQAYMHLMKLKIDYFNKTNNAEFLNNINVDIENMTAITDDSLFFVITQVFSMLGGIIGLFIIDYRLTILVLLFIPVKIIVMKYFAKKRKEIMNRYIDKSSKYAKWFGDTIGGVREIRFFQVQKAKKEEFTKIQKNVLSNYKDLNMIFQWNSNTNSVMISFLTMALYILGANMVFNLELSIGSVFAFITYSVYVTSPISAILNIGYLLSGIIPSAKRYYEFMDWDEEDNASDEIPKEGDLKFEQVSFSYNNEKEVLKDITFCISKGSKIALMGKNGCGKSTIMNLILRLYEPQSGKILLNEEDIRKYSLIKYREMISVVSQQVYLFNDTIKNNICMYKEIPLSFLMEIVEDCGLSKFITEVSMEYVVGENGVMLSGGQKQKIALARALVQDNPILIFDEATSNADVYSETHINHLLQTKLKNKTVIVVTHKKAILGEVDAVLFIEKGEINAYGTYDELYENNIKFRDMIDFDRIKTREQ